MKKVDTVLKEYVSKLSFDTLKYLFDRFEGRMGPDLHEAIEIIAKNSEIDRMLGAAKNYEEFWKVVDQVAMHVEKEFMRRTPDVVSHA